MLLKHDKTGSHSEKYGCAYDFPECPPLVWNADDRLAAILHLRNYAVPC